MSCIERNVFSDKQWQGWCDKNYVNLKVPESLWVNNKLNNIHDTLDIFYFINEFSHKWFISFLKV